MRSHLTHTSKVRGDVSAMTYRAAHDTAHRLYGAGVVGPPVPPLALKLFTVALGVEFALTQANSQFIPDVSKRKSREEIANEWAEAFADTKD
jgi:hypothetical protein